MRTLSTEYVVQGTAETIDAAEYHGCILFGAAAGSVLIYNYTDATDATKIVGGAMVTAANEADHDEPGCPVALDQTGKLHIVVTGAGNYAIIRFAPRQPTY